MVIIIVVYIFSDIWWRLGQFRTRTPYVEFVGISWKWIGIQNRRSILQELCIFLYSYRYRSLCLIQFHSNIEKQTRWIWCWKHLDGRKWKILQVQRIFWLYFINVKNSQVWIYSSCRIASSWHVFNERSIEVLRKQKQDKRLVWKALLG